MLSSHSSWSKVENTKRRFSRGSASLPTFPFLSRKLKLKDSLRFLSDIKPIDAPLQISKIRNSPKDLLYKTISVDIMRRISSISKRSSGNKASSKSKKRKNKKKNRKRNKNKRSGGESSDTSTAEILPPAPTVEEDKATKSQSSIVSEEKILSDQQEVYDKFKKHEEIYFPDISPNFSWCDEEPDTRQYPLSNSSFIDFNNSSLEFDVDLNLPAEPELYSETNTEVNPGVEELEDAENKYTFSSEDEEDPQVAFSPFESIPEADEKENWYSVLGYIKRLLPSRKATIEPGLGPQDMSSLEELASLAVDEIYAPISLREPLKLEEAGLKRNGPIDVSIFQEKEEGNDEDNRIGSRACEEDISLTFETADDHDTFDDGERRTVKFRNFVEKTIYSGKLPSFIQLEGYLPLSEKLSSTETPHDALPFTDPVVNSSANSSEISIESQDNNYPKERSSLSKISGCNSTRELIANKSILRSKTNSNYDLEKLYSIEHEMIDFQTFFEEFEYRENQRLYQNSNLETIRTRLVQKYYDKIYGHL